MDKKFIPNCRQDNSPNPTPLLKPSGRSGRPVRNDLLSKTREGLEEQTLNFETDRLCIRRVRSSKFEVGRSTFKIHPFAESDGCLVVLAVFKTVVGSFHGPRWVRFLPSPPLC